MTSFAKFQKRVNKGVDILDDKLPNWYNLLTLDDLNLANPENCVGGQLGALSNQTYFEFMISILGANEDWYKYGFDCDGDNDFDCECEKLTAAWLLVVHSRRKAHYTAQTNDRFSPVDPGKL